MHFISLCLLFHTTGPAARDLQLVGLPDVAVRRILHPVSKRLARRTTTIVYSPINGRSYRLAVHLGVQLNLVNEQIPSLEHVKPITSFHASAHNRHTSCAFVRQSFRSRWCILVMEEVTEEKVKTKWRR